MIRLIKIFIIVFVFSSCKKDEVNCSGDDCNGQISYHLTNNDRTYIITKDTVYKYININNDTLRLNFRKTFTEPYRYNQTCACNDKSTDISGECIYSIYSFINRDIAVKYGLCNTTDGTTAFDIVFADTNSVMHKINANNDSTSQFWTKDILSKMNDFDSIQINGKYFYNIVSTYDNIAGSTHPSITNCILSKKVGIISFKYNNILFSLVH